MPPSAPSPPLPRRFLSSLEDPLLTHRLGPAWVAAGDVLAQGAGLEEVVALVDALPLANRAALRILVRGWGAGRGGGKGWSGRWG